MLRKKSDVDLNPPLIDLAHTDQSPSTTVAVSRMEETNTTELLESAKKSMRQCDVGSVRLAPARPKEGVQLTKKQGTRRQKKAKNGIVYKGVESEVIRAHYEMG